MKPIIWIVKYYWYLTPLSDTSYTFELLNFFRLIKIKISSEMTKFRKETPSISRIVKKKCWITRKSHERKKFLNPRSYKIICWSWRASFSCYNFFLVDFILRASNLIESSIHVDTHLWLPALAPSTLELCGGIYDI